MLQAGPAVPPGIFSKQDCYNKRRWHQVQYLADVFWQRWVREYLPSLQEQQKMEQEVEEICSRQHRAGTQRQETP